MATDLGQAKAQQGAKYDAYVAAHLGRAESRIRVLDLTTGLLGFLAGTLAYAIVMAILDRRFDLPGSVREIAFVAYLVGAGLYLARMVVRPLRRRVNPYYAARQVEQALPGAKNSVINWIDLHEQKLPPAIRSALGQRAAKDLARADLERAISSRRAGWVGAAALALAVAFVVLFLSYGRQPFSYLMGRAFAPFNLLGPAPTRTQLTVARPEGGNTTITVGRALPILVEVGGKVPDPKAPDALRVLYRYQEGDPYQERFLQSESARAWSTTFAAIDVRDGFYYKVVGGDAETPEYRVDVRATPQVTDFRVTYRYRPYVARVDEVRHDRALKALRGTRVVLLVRTNRTLKEGRVEFEGKEGARTLPAERVEDDPEALRVRFVLEDSGQYRIHFTSADNETFAEGRFHPVTALPDLPPRVELTRPGQDIRLPASGVLRLEGKATDDVGVKSLVLKSQVDGTRLQPRPYRSESKLRLPGGGYARALDYKDFLDLARVQTQEGKPFALQPGTELEYWLEASDACDYPKANVAQSKHFRVKITPPDKDEKKQQQERRQADKEQKDHETAQDEQIRKEDQARQEERRAEEERRQEEARQDEERRKQEGQGGQGDQAKPDEGKGGKGPGDPRQSKDGRGEDKKPKDGPDKANPNGGNRQGNAEQQEKDRKADETAQKLNDLLDKKEKEQAGGQGKQGEKSEAKGDPQAPGEAKDGGQGEGKQGNKDGDQGKQGEQDPGAGKGGGKEKAEKEAGKDKGQGKPGEKQGAGKDEGRRDEKPGQKGAGKDGKPKAQPGSEAAEGKDKGKPGEQPERAQAKKAGAGEGRKEASKDKPAADPGMGERTARSEGKQAGAKGQTADSRPQGENKGKRERAEKAGGKGAGKEDVARKEPRAAPKGGGNPAGSQSAKGQEKGAPHKPGGQDVARSEPKPDTKGRGNAANEPDPKARRARAEDVDKLARDLKSPDAGKREEAARSLEKIMKQARDPEARKGARRELAQLLDVEPSKAKSRKPGQGECAECKGSKGAKESEAGKPKSGGKEGQARGDSKGEGQPTQTAKTPGGSEGTGEGQQPGAGSDKGNPKGMGGEPGNEPGGGTGRERRADQGRPQTPEQDTHQPSKPEPHRATVMQLERYEKLVDKKMRAKAGISDEDWKQFLQSLRDKAQREQAEAAGAEKFPGPQQGNLPSAGGRRPRPRPAGPAADDVRTPGRGQPPPGYRDAYSEFLRRIAADKDKK